MTPEEVVTALPQLRYSPVRGRRLGLAYIARSAGVAVRTLYRVIENGSISPAMTEQVAAALGNVTRGSEPQRSSAIHQAAFGPAPISKQVRPRKPL